MDGKGMNQRIIFGLKARKARMEAGMSFAALAAATGMSVSYLNEIEKGKKFPKPDKIELLAKALKLPAEELTSMHLPKSMAPVEDLLQSNFLNELPLDLFGVELSKVVEMIAGAPSRVGAFIATLLELGRNYAMAEENFYFGALRSYLEMHNNFFPELEDAVDSFIRQNHFPTHTAIPISMLRRSLEAQYHYEINEHQLMQYSELKDLRALFLPKSRKLLLNDRLSESQVAFQLGKELGFNFLNLKERAYTSSLLRVESFEQVLSHFKAGYFSAALLINRNSFINDLEQFFANPNWESSWLINLLKKYSASPEMLFQRMTNLLPEYLGIEDIFLLRFIHQPSNNQLRMDKELHLNRRHQPHSNAIKEHYCRRWLSFSLFKKLENAPGPVIGAQISKYHDTRDQYLCLTIADHTEEDRNICVTLGMLINPELKKRVSFSADPAIPVQVVNNTCERCPILDCAERVAPPSVIEKKENFKQLMKRIDQLQK